MARREWTITINDFQGGLAPGYFFDNYPSFGNNNQAGKMTDCDLTNPSYVTQGPGFTEIATVSQMADKMNAIIDRALNLGGGEVETFGGGENELYVFDNNSINETHTVMGPSGSGVVSVEYFNNKAYYAYQKASGAADMGRRDSSSPGNYNDDWLSTSESVTLNGNSATPYPYPLTNGTYKGSPALFLGHGNDVLAHTASGVVAEALDLPQDHVIQSMRWNQDTLWIASKTPGVGSKNECSIFAWDGADTSWFEEIRLKGDIGALFVKDGIVFVFYKEVTQNGGSKIGFVNQNVIQELAEFETSLPGHHQVTEWNNHIIWDGGGTIFAFGARESRLPNKIFKLATASNSGGALAAPFGVPMASNENITGTTVVLEKFSGYSTNADYKSLVFDVGFDAKKSKITTLAVNHETAGAGARVDVKLVNNKGTTLKTIPITDTTSTRTLVHPNVETDNFRVELDWSNGSTTKNMKVKNIYIAGHTIT